MADWGRVITAMATPFTSALEVDLTAAAKLADFLLGTGTNDLVVCGTTGESPTLSLEEKLLLFRAMADHTSGRCQIIAGVGSNDTSASMELAQGAERAGVHGLLLVAPYYNRPSQEGMYQHFRAIAECTSLPVMLYNVPPRTSSNIEASTVLRLARDVPNIVAVKEASGNLAQVTDILIDAPPGFRVYSGDDGLTLPILSLGGYGVVSVSAHLVGRDMQAMHQAFLKGDVIEAARLHRAMHPIVKACFQSTVPSPSPVKAGLNLLGVNVGGVRLPLVECNENELEIVRKSLCNYGLLA